MDAACQSLNTAQFRAAFLSVGKKFPQCGANFLLVWKKLHKAENLLITKGKFSDFSLPKAENILKRSQLMKW